MGKGTEKNAIKVRKKEVKNRDKASILIMCVDQRR